MTSSLVTSLRNSQSKFYFYQNFKRNAFIFCQKAKYFNLFQNWGYVLNIVFHYEKVYLIK